MQNFLPLHERNRRNNLLTNNLEKTTIIIMKKDKILQFISRYNLNGNVEAVKWETTGEDTCTTTFITDDKSVLGQVTVKESFFQNEGEVGVYDTARLKQLLTVVGDDIDVEVT